MPRMLGKRPARHDARTLKLARYTAALPSPPTSCDLTGKITNLGMMLNDSLGDCTCAAIGHTIQAWTAEGGAQVILPDTDILSAYELFCGYKPGDPSTDQGGVELDVLNGWRKAGVGGHTIGAYATLQKSAGGVFHRGSWQHDVMNAVHYFGAAYIGVQLTDADVQDAAWIYHHGGTRDGHAIPIVAYDPDGVTVITWGQLVKASWSFINGYMDEAYCLLSSDIIGSSGTSPEGFDLSQLQSDLQAVTA